MLACGFVDSAYVDNTVMTTNDQTRAEQFMVDQHFTYAWPASRLVCKSQAGLPACRGRAIDAQRCCAPANAAGAR